MSQIALVNECRIDEVDLKGQQEVDVDFRTDAPVLLIHTLIYLIQMNKIGELVLLSQFLISIQLMTLKKLVK
jgi:hypothetical protein